MTDPAPPSARRSDAIAPVLPKELLDEFARRGTARTFPRNAIVVVEGQPADALYLVLGGSLTVFLDDDTGKVAELTRLGPGEYFGELMLGSAVRTASVRTNTAARLCMITRAEFEAIVRERPDLALHVIQTLIARVAALTDSVRGLALMDVYGRVAKLLRESAVATPDGQVVRGMSQRSIAERVGASRSMVNRILKDLSAGGYVRATRATIELLKPLPRRW